MTWGLVAVGGATLLSGVAQSEAAKDAAKEAGRGGSAAIGEQRAARESFEQRTEPFRQIGLSAVPELASLLGLDISGVQNPEFVALQDQLNALRGSTPGDSPRDGSGVLENEVLGAATGLGGAVFGDTFGGGESRASGSFKKRQRRLAAERAAEIEGLESQLANTQEFLFPGEAPPSGGQGLPLLEEVNPLVGFLRDEGFEDIQESAAAQGRLRSGGTLEDLTEFNLNLSSTVAPQLQQQRFNQLFSMLGLGQSTAVGQGSAGLNTASNIGNIMQANATAQGNAALQEGQIQANTLGNLAGVLGRFGPSGVAQPNASPVPAFGGPQQTPQQFTPITPGTRI